MEPQQRERRRVAVDKRERHPRARLQSRIIVESPFEVGQRPDLTRRIMAAFGNRRFGSRRLAWWSVVHRPHVVSGADPRNFHAHLCITTGLFRGTALVIGHSTSENCAKFAGACLPGEPTRRRSGSPLLRRDRPAKVRRSLARDLVGRRERPYRRSWSPFLRRHPQGGQLGFWPGMARSTEITSSGALRRPQAIDLRLQQRTFPVRASQVKLAILDGEVVVMRPDSVSLYPTPAHAAYGSGC